ncbi:hypothetical protein D9M70_512660 [compost metagenome]
MGALGHPRQLLQGVQLLRCIPRVAANVLRYRLQLWMILQSPSQHFGSAEHERQRVAQFMADISREPTLALQGLAKLIRTILYGAGQYADLVSGIEPGQRPLPLLVLNRISQIGQGQNHPACAGSPNQEGQGNASQKRQAQCLIGPSFKRLEVSFVIDYGVALAIHFTDQHVKGMVIQAQLMGASGQALQRLRELLADEEIQVANLRVRHRAWV